MTDRNPGTKRKAGEEDHGAGRGTLMDLPEDLMADVLRRLPPRYLAACRSVCRYWRDAVDGRGMLLAVAHLVPRHVRGILINFARREGHSFFSRAVVAPSIDGALGFLPRRRVTRSAVLDHHNGLVLCEKRGRIYACNPATRRWGKLPRPPIRWCPLVRRPDLYLVFDPTVSLHYDVLLFPEAPHRPNPPPCSSSPSVKENYEQELNTAGSMEWPPRVYTVHVFSSRNGQWEERQFIREGVDAAITVSDVWSDPWAPTAYWCTFRRYAVYWRQEFYLHCHGGFVMRLSLLDGKYLVIPTPKLDNYVRQSSYQYKKEGDKRIPYVYLAKSEQGVYFTAVTGYKLSVWVLHETSDSSSCRMPKWELKHEADLGPSFVQNYIQRQSGQEMEPSWILDPREEGKETSNNSLNHEWGSDDDGIEVSVKEGGIGEYDDDNKRSLDPYYGMDLLGYHPYKEIVFLDFLLEGYAYCLGSSKLQYLGSHYTADLIDSLRPAPTLESFIYTPCMDDLLPTRS